MTKQTEALKLALEALEHPGNIYHIDCPRNTVITALRETLAEQPAQQEPVATLWQHGETGRTRITMPGDITDCDARWFKAADLYTSPPAQRKPLTDEQTHDAVGTAGVDLLELAKLWSNNKIHVYQFDNEARKIIKGVLHRAHSIKENT